MVSSNLVSDYRYDHKEKVNDPNNVPKEIQVEVKINIFQDKKVSV